MLSKLAGLTVIARSSSSTYKGKSADIRQVARDLGVRFVMTGSVRRSGNRLRIAAQLSDGERGAQLWAESYARDLADVFEVQEELARKIVDELRVKLSPAETAQWPGIVSTGTTNVEAYNCFLRGRATQRGATQNADIFNRTRELFQQAIDHDPAYAAPYAGLGMAFAHDYANGWTPDAERSLIEARRLVDEAVRRDPTDPFSHGVSALVSMHEKDFERWTAEVKAALSLNPNFAPALSLRGILNMHSGKPLAAIEDIEQAMRLDPLFTHLYLHHLGVAHILAGKYETGAALLKERILLVPETDVSRAYLAAVLGILGKVDEARQIWTDLMKTNPNYSFGERIGGINPSDLKRIAEGLERAGLPVPK
jgi:tetratricopeptide (TPR) repeat protein